MSAATLDATRAAASEIEGTPIDSDSVAEHGRLYQTFKQGRYVLPNDGEEQRRLNSQHRLLRLLQGNALGLAPVDMPKFVLDIGTGPGDWAIEFASDNPLSQVIGTDLSLIQPRDPPKNCRFVRADAEEEQWGFGVLFDYVHLRMMVSCFDKPQQTIGNIFRNMASGGWIECQDIDMEAHSDDASTRGTSVETLGKCLEGGLRALNRDPKIARKYKDMLLTAGFVDVAERQLALPCGTWPKDHERNEIGRLFLETYTERGLHGMSMKLLLAAGLSADDITKLLAATVLDYHSPDVHGYVNYYVVYGRKP